MENDGAKGIIEKLKACKKPLIVMRKNAGADDLGASLGLFLAMKKLKKDPCIASPSKISRKYEYLDEYDSIKQEIENKCEYCITFDLENEDVGGIHAERAGKSLKIRIEAGKDSVKTETLKLSREERAADLIITVSVPELKLMGKIYDDNAELFRSSQILSINNSKNAENYDALAISDCSKTVSEIVFKILSDLDASLIDSKVATALLSGIISGTNNFQRENIGYQTFEAASRLMASGADRDEVIRFFKRSNIPFYVIECYGKIADKIGRSQNISQAYSRIEEFARSKKLSAAEKAVLILMVAAFAVQNTRNSGNIYNAGQSRNISINLSKRNIVYAVDKLPISDEIEAVESISAPASEKMESAPEVEAQVAAPMQTIEIAEPKTLKISDIKVNANIQYVGLNEDGSVGVPSNEKDVAWYMFGPMPGESGNAVILGHRDSATNPNGVFRRLNELAVGDLIEVTDMNGNALKFKVVKKSSYDDKNSPIKEIFGTTEKKMLNLITCSGAWNQKTNNYTKRIVVYSELIE